jgi:hypothetical protein
VKVFQALLKKVIPQWNNCKQESLLKIADDCLPGGIVYLIGKIIICSLD